MSSSRRWGGPATTMSFLQKILEGNEINSYMIPQSPNSQEMRDLLTSKAKRLRVDNNLGIHMKLQVVNFCIGNS